MKQARPYPRVTVTRKAARSLAGGHPWVFEGEIISAEPAENGAIVDVFEENGTWQGAGLLSQESKIRVRVVSRNANDRFDDAFWSRRVAWAWQHRRVAMGGRGLPGAEPDTTCCRVVFSEADGLPGLVADRYENVLVTQVGTVGMEHLRPVVYRALVDALAADGEKIDAIYERNDGASRAKEGLPQYKGWWDGLPAPKTARLVVRENGLRFDLDLENSQKTGFFLDQKYNRRAVREIAGGRRVLDCFCHVGPFGLNAAAGGAEFVRCVDVSDTAIELARENARLNGLDDRMGFTCANVLDYLPELARDRVRTPASTAWTTAWASPARTSSTTCPSSPATAPGCARRAARSTSSCWIRPPSPRAAAPSPTPRAATGRSTTRHCACCRAAGTSPPAAAPTS